MTREGEPTTLKRLNVGCGNRFSINWTNLDFNATSRHVIAHNLFKPLPFADNSFDAVYSSHVLEHFNKADGERLIKECARILKPGGVLRIVVPDLENVCREYLRCLEAVQRGAVNEKQYDWTLIELLDQMVREQPGGLMMGFWKDLIHSGDTELTDYVESRTGTNIAQAVNPGDRGITSKLRRVTLARVPALITRAYVAAVTRLIPGSIRKNIVSSTSFGERHKWMYDRFGLKRLIQRCGLGEIVFLDAFHSNIPFFTSDLLDVRADGKAHKKASLYCESVKPPSRAAHSTD